MRRRTPPGCGAWTCSRPARSCGTRGCRRSCPYLTALRLNGLRAEIDCALFQALPELVDLTILNSKRTINVEALLDCRKLSHLSVVNCGNPFRRGIGAGFRNARFTHLDIRYA
ncbi:hypothetical protein [Plantactinospora sonchi]|uniref:Leucine-rich repeat domain-containing protein n=1 Tax=Plantactinospora sonchi TaxID=1544735 RepID=A0ABU7RRM5_9ACTN